MDSRAEEENPNNKKHLRKSKWTIMLFSSFLLMGDYFAYDVPFAIKEDLRAKFGNLSNDEFSSNFDHLYTVYLLPNIFLPLLNGILTEKLGDRRLLSVLGCIVFLGSGIVSLGSIQNSFPLMIVGRFVYGLGGDSITSTQWSMILEYFHSDYEVGIAMAVVFLFTTLGSTLNLYFSPILVDHIGCNGIFLFTAGGCFLSLFFRYLIYQIDRKVILSIKYENESQNKGISVKKNEENNEILKQAPDGIKQNCFKEYFRMDKRFWLNALYSIFIFISLNSLDHFSSEFFLNFWYPDLGSTEFHRKKTFFNFVSTAASMVFVPILGLIADRFAIHSQMALLSPLVLQTAFIFYILISPLMPSILYSFGTSLNYTGMWANLSYCVDDRTMNMAVGTLYSLQNITGLITPYLMFFIKKITNSVEGAIYFMMIMNFLGLIFAMKFHFSKEKPNLKYMELDEEKKEVMSKNQTKSSLETSVD